MDKDWLKKLEIPKQKNIVLVISKTSNERFNVEENIRKLTNSKIIILDNFSINPIFSDSVKASKVLLHFNYKILIAFGGGSTIDFAKTIIAIQTLNIKSKDVIDQNVINKKNKRNFNFITIPTTAGTGSEETNFAVTYIKKKKYSIENEVLFPDRYVLDPFLSYSCNKKQKTASALDALCQSIESYWSKKATQESMYYSEMSIKLIWNNLEKSINQNNFKAHEKIVLGSNFSGKAINISKTTGPHALSYYISNKFKISHGIAVCLTMGSFFKYHNKIIKKSNNIDSRRLKEKTRSLELFLNTCPNGLDKVFKKMILKLKVNASLSKNHIKKTELLKIASSVDIVRLKNHPLKLTRSGLLEILENSF